jgi:hypothetical protein
LAIPLYDAEFFVFFMTLTLALSYYCYKLFEIPSQDWIRKRCI